MSYTRGARIIGFTPSFPPFAILFHAMLFAVRVVDWLWYTITIKGRENLSQIDGAVLVSNHTLLLDPGIIAHAIRPCRTYFTMLEETALIPFLGTFVRLLGGVPIPDRPGALATLDSAARTALQELRFIHFFPEGECYQGGQDIRPFHPGAFLVACRLGVPVVPITTILHERRWLGRNAFRVFGKTMRLPLRITVVIGQPVAPPLAVLPAAGVPEIGFSLKKAARSLAQRVQEIMQATIDGEGGSRNLYRGMMPRLVKRDKKTASAPAMREEPAAKIM